MIEIDRLIWIFNEKSFTTGLSTKFPKISIYNTKRFYLFISNKCWFLILKLYSAQFHTYNWSNQCEVSLFRLIGQWLKWPNKFKWVHHLQLPGSLVANNILTIVLKRLLSWMHNDNGRQINERMWPLSVIMHYRCTMRINMWTETIWYSARNNLITI